MTVDSVLVLGGAGDMGSGVVEELVKLGARVDIGDINMAKAQSIAQSLREIGEVGVVRVDASSREELTSVVKDYDVVVNAVGPFYKYGYAIAETVIDAGKNGIDLCDDHDAAEQILRLSDQAARKGVTYVTGLGWTPGLSNILAKMGVEKLGGEADSVDIGWFGSAADSRGLAVVMHLFHAMTGEVPMFLDGRVTSVKAGSSGLTFEFPDVGRLKLYYVGHPEPLTIPSHLRVMKRVTIRGCLIPEWQTSLAMLFVRLGLTSTQQRVERLSKFINKIEDVFRTGGVALSGVKVIVERGEKRVSYASVNRMRKLTTAPAALGAHLILKDQIVERGVFPPEAIIDPHPFLEKLEAMGVTVSTE
ncbi:MAG: saccharopine dehydrogenase NADP-binding domain-containing protein [Nitrososphaerota archaeon]